MFRFGLLTRHRDPDPEPTAADAADRHDDYPDTTIATRAISLRRELLDLRAAGIHNPEQFEGALIVLGIRREQQLDYLITHLLRLTDRLGDITDAVRDRR